MGASGAARAPTATATTTSSRSRDRQSPVFKLNLPRTCARCHSNPGPQQGIPDEVPGCRLQYQESIHGKALLEMGLIVAPSCNDCHGVHDIKRSVDRSSPINKAHVATTCGKCHFGVEEIYNKSVHGQLLAKGDPRGPVCTDCHTAHQIEHPDNGNFKSISDQRCGSCHQDRLEHYRETYHGKAMALGRPNVASEVAACYDCHGHHDVLPPSDPASHLSSANIVQHLPALPPGCKRRLHQVPAARQPDGRPQLPGPPPRLPGDDRIADRRVHLLRRAHRSLADPFGLSLPARLEEVPRGEGGGPERRRMVYPIRSHRAIPALPGRHQFPAARHHGHAAEVLLHDMGPGRVPRDRRRGCRPAPSTVLAP